MPSNICVPLFNGGDKPLSYRASADVIGKRFVKVSADIQSGPDITSTALPTTYDGGNFQCAPCTAGAKAAGVSGYDALTGVLLPVLKRGNVVPVTCGASVTAGQEVESDATGKAIPLASGRANGLAHTSAANAADAYIELY